MLAWTLTAVRLEDARRAPRVGTAALTTEAEKVRADMVLCVCGNESQTRPAPFSRALELLRIALRRAIGQKSFGKIWRFRQAQCPYETRSSPFDEARFLDNPNFSLADGRDGTTPRHD